MSDTMNDLVTVVPGSVTGSIVAAASYYPEFDQLINHRHPAARNVYTKKELSTIYYGLRMNTLAILEFDCGVKGVFDNVQQFFGSLTA